MSVTLSSLNQLHQTSFSLNNTPSVVSIDHQPVKKQMVILTELTFIYVLKLLGVEDEKKLEEIVSRLREGTPFYDFTVLAHNLAKSRTDFDFLSSPENIAAYQKILAVAKECGVVLLPYVNVLAKIAENKQYGLYSENQEVKFFLDEYDYHKDSVDSKEFLHQFKKILKFETQQLFERFINDKIFSLIQQTLISHSEKITSEQTLAIYVYCLYYYNDEISNSDENFLHKHIEFCVDYLSKHREIEFKPQKVQRKIPKFENEEESLEFFFIHNAKVRNSLDRFCAMLKDISPTVEAIDFCNFLRNNLYNQTPELFDENKSPFNQIIARIIRERAKAENVSLYKEICKLLPNRVVCQRSPHLLHHGGYSYYHFFDKHDNFLFYAKEDGNKNKKTPSAHVLIELNILKMDEKGNVILWDWRYISDMLQGKFQ